MFYWTIFKCSDSNLLRRGVPINQKVNCVFQCGLQGCSWKTVSVWMNPRPLYFNFWINLLPTFSFNLYSAPQLFLLKLYSAPQFFKFIFLLGQAPKLNLNLLRKLKHLSVWEASRNLHKRILFSELLSCRFKLTFPFQYEAIYWWLYLKLKSRMILIKYLDIEKVLSVWILGVHFELYSALVDRVLQISFWK